MCLKSIEDIKIDELMYEACNKRYELEQKLKETVNAARKEVQRQLDTLKNKQLGPKWSKAFTDYAKLEQLNKEKDELQYDLQILENHEQSIEPAVQFLHKIGYIKHDNPLKLTNGDLTLKGILATEVNEGHQILMTELYTQELLHDLPGEEIVAVLSCFQEEKETEDSPLISELNVSEKVRSTLNTLKTITSNLINIEEEIGNPVQNYWNISTQMIEPMRRWIEGENASIICQEHGLFEGNFVRTIMKMTNMLDEWLAMATYCQHVDQVNKIMEVRSRMTRDIVILDSLYLHL